MGFCVKKASFGHFFDNFDNRQSLRIRQVELSRSDDEERYREKLARIVLDEMYQFVGLLDTKGNLLEANRAALELGGVPLSSVVGKPFWEAYWWRISTATQEQLKRAIARAAKGETVRYDVEVNADEAGRETIYIDFSILPIKDSFEKVVFLLPEAINITEKKRIEHEIAQKNQELEQLLERLRELDELKNQFIANVSHELRTPLTLILGPAERMLSAAETSLTVGQRRDLEVIQRNARLLLKRVNDILDISKLAAARLSIDYGRTDIAHTVRLLVGYFEALAKQRSILVVLESPAQLIVEVDAEKLERIILNIVGNAFKFVPDHGQINIRLQAGEHRFRLEVQDNGPGVSLKDQDRIFERFSQGEGGATRLFEGTGLGLAIAKEFVGLHGGAIGLADAPEGTGALFWVELPLKAREGTCVRTLDNQHFYQHVNDHLKGTLIESQPFQRTSNPSLPVHGQSDRPTVLVVEDNPEMNQFIGEILQAEFQVLSAFNGDEGLEKALECKPDLIVTDIMMPRMSCDQLITSLRQQQADHFANVPILIVSAKSDDALIIKLLRNGAQDCVKKPFLAEELLARARNLIQFKTAQAQLHALNVQLEQQIEQRTRDFFDQHRLLNAIVEGTDDAVFAKDLEGRYLLINEGGTRIIGKKAEEILGKTDTEFLSPNIAAAIQANDRKILQREAIQSSEDVLEVQGIRRTYLTTRGPLRDYKDAIVGLVGIAQDITERKLTEERLKFLAHHDALTNLPNRTLLYDRMEMYFLAAERQSRKVGVLFLDLDKLKLVNDSLGHSVGDQLIVAVASRLKRCIRAVDTVARLSGDEFVLVLSELRNREEAADLAKKLLAAIAVPYKIDLHEIAVTATIGISLFPRDGDKPETLLHRADLALYSAKSMGRNTYQFYTHLMGDKATDRLNLQQALRRAIEREEFVVHYQPKFELNTGRLCGAEALVRWNHPALGLLSPAYFIPMAEETGQILQIDAWMLREVCRQNSVWQQRGFPKIPIAVNLSALQFCHRDFPQKVTDTLKNAGLDGRYLECELTESVVMSRPDLAIEIISKLKRLGIQFSIDDFGTGYSSLSYLKRFQVDKLKIDKSFISGSASNQEDMAIVRAILSMAKSLNLTVVAEGVEDEDARQFLMREQCDEVQGYYYSKPLPVEAFERVMTGLVDSNP